MVQLKPRYGGGTSVERTGCSSSSYKSFNNLLCYWLWKYLLPTESTLDCTELQKDSAQREKIIGTVAEKCFKWQLTASGSWNGVFRQNCILSAPLLASLLLPATLPPLSQPSPSFLLHPSPLLLSSKTVVMKICFVVSFFTCIFPRLTHCALVQMNVSAQEMSLPPLRKSSWAQSRPRGYFTTAVHTHTFSLKPTH